MLFLSFLFESYLDKMDMAVLGTGNAGQHIGKALIRLKHNVTFGSRTPKTAKVPIGAGIMDQKTSIKNAEIVFLAIPGSKAVETIKAIGPTAFNGKIIVDMTNILTKDDEWAFDYFRIRTPLEGKLSGAEEIAKLVPEAKVVKAFNVVFAGLMESGQVGNEKLALFIAGDDKSSKAKVAKIGRDIGFETFDVGPLKVARHLEAVGLVMIKISADKNWSDIGFRVLESRKS